MRSNAHLKAVNLPPFIYTASDKALDNDIEVMDMLIKVYKAEMVRILLDLCVLGVFVMLLCACK